MLCRYHSPQRCAASAAEGDLRLLEGRCSMSFLRCGGLLLSLILACGLLLSCGLLGLTASAKAGTGGQRLRPPTSLQCPRNNLTAFNGRVLSFHRDPERTVIRLHTDANTTEQFTLRHPVGSDATQWFLLRGKSFQPGDWALIESTQNHLRPDMRAIIWVCDDGTNPVIDWRPSETSQR
jgi:hypothetical protein